MSRWVFLRPCLRNVSTRLSIRLRQYNKLQNINVLEFLICPRLSSLQTRTGPSTCIASSCLAGTHSDGALMCIDDSCSGRSDVAKLVCWVCPSGYNDQGAYCSRCPGGYTNYGLTCTNWSTFHSTSADTASIYAKGMTNALGSLFLPPVQTPTTYSKYSCRCFRF